MAVEVLADGNRAAMYCNTSDHAFGPVFGARLPVADARIGSKYVALAFVRWCYDHADTDPRRAEYPDIRAEWREWLEDKRDELEDDDDEDRDLATYVLEELA